MESLDHCKYCRFSCGVPCMFSEVVLAGSWASGCHILRIKALDIKPQ